MSSDLIHVATSVEDFFKDACPSDWKVINAEKLNASKTTGVVLTYEQLDISQQVETQQLSYGWVWVTFQLVLSVPETDAAKALPRLTAAASRLIQIMDASPEVVWGPSLTRTRLTSGESAFIVPFAVLAANPTTTP